MLAVAVVALALGAGCARVDRRGAGVYVEEPWVDVGTFTRVGGEEAWVFAPAVGPYGWRKHRVPVWVTPETDILFNGTHAGLADVAPGQKVRLTYEIRRDGTGVAERIDIIGPERDGEYLDAAY
jgi:hypothetical protein